MKKFAILSTALFIAVLLTVSVSAQTGPATPPANKSEDLKKDEGNPLVTEWDVNIAAPGQDLAGTLKIEKDGEGFKGKVITDYGEAPLKNIKISGDSFTGDMTANVQGQSFEGSITGKLADGKLTGEINLAGLGSIPYTGKKPEKK